MLVKHVLKVSVKSEKGSVKKYKELSEKVVKS